MGILFNEPLSGHSPFRLPNGSMNTEYTESGIWVFTTAEFNILIAAYVMTSYDRNR